METKNIERLRHYTVLENSDVNHKFLTLDEGNDQESVIPLNESDSEGICRVCANSNSHLVPIFEGQGLQLDLVTKMHKYLPIQVTENDTLSTQLCYHCTITIIAFNDIVEGCLEAEQKLIQLQEDKIQKISEERRADLTFEQAEIIKDPQEDEIEIQQAQIVVELSIDKDGENSQETGLEKTETSRCRELAKISEIYEQFPTDYSLPFERIPDHMPEMYQMSLNFTEISKPPQKSKFCSIICDLCGSSFKTKQLLKSHLTFHDFAQVENCKDEYQLVEDARKKINDKVGFECTRCSKIVFTKRGFLRHLRIHSNTRPCVCRICRKAYRICQDLAKHIKDVHNRVRNYECDICQKAFAGKGARDDHRRTHTGERPYKCEHCSKTFKTLNSVYVHNRIHADYKPHKCETCRQYFRTRQRLNNHMTTHTGIKAFACEICEKPFALKSEVARHRATHNTEKRFSCGGCEMKFAQKRYLRNHIKVHHRERAEELLKGVNEME
ncbi:zinc finger protein 468 isoform X2 [Diachasma alloeum]|uniref:zinc finger protein 468 isoform X2 n=1 Tax=Diachasma alloeum TaxID=454923 RepID=UPI0007381021|nr:zinc finger protein 468 isoform X2 [Diachasma alloeum]